MVISVHEYLLTTCTPNLYFKKILKLFISRTDNLICWVFFIKKCIIEWNCFSLILFFIYLFIQRFIKFSLNGLVYTEYVSNRVLHAYVCLEGSQFTVNSLLLVRDKCLTANLHLYELIYKQLIDIYENCPDAANKEIIMSPAHFDNFGYQRALTLTNKYEFTVINLKLNVYSCKSERVGSAHSPVTYIALVHANVLISTWGVFFLIQTLCIVIKTVFSNWQRISTALTVLQNWLLKCKRM